MDKSIDSKLDTIIDLLQTLVEQMEQRNVSNIPGYCPPPDIKYLEKKIWWDNEERREKRKMEVGDWPPGPSVTCNSNTK